MFTLDRSSAIMVFVCVFSELKETDLYFDLKSGFCHPENKSVAFIPLQVISMPCMTNTWHSMAYQLDSPGVRRASEQRRCRASEIHRTWRRRGTRYWPANPQSHGSHGPSVPRENAALGHA